MAVFLNVRRIDIDTGGHNQIVLLRGRDADAFGIVPGDQLQISYGRKKTVAVADITHYSIRHGEIGAFNDVWQTLKVRDGQAVKVEILARPLSVNAIKKKLLGQEINAREIRSIIEDIVKRRLSSIETTYFVASGYVKPYTDRELIAMVKAMSSTGDTFKWSGHRVVDKHSIGGLAGNRTTLITVPIIASCGLLIPKTSSRAITSPSGTADTMEVLAPVTFSAERVRHIVKHLGGCLIWGGGLSIAPADDLIIRVSKPLSLEPYDKMIVSILAKKVAMGVKYLIIDLPFGQGTKVPNLAVGTKIADRFKRIGRAFNMTIEVKFDPAHQPIGSGIGPALEARDVLRVLQQKDNRPRDLEKKSVELAGRLLEISGRVTNGQGRNLAIHQLKSGQAWEKMQAIIRWQGGRWNIDSESVLQGAVTKVIKAKQNGRVSQINNRAINDIARTLGAPDHKLAGIYLHRKIGQTVKRGQPIMTLYSPNASRLKLASQTLARPNVIRITR